MMIINNSFIDEVVGINFYLLQVFCVINKKINCLNYNNNLMYY